MRGKGKLISGVLLFLLPFAVLGGWLDRFAYDVFVWDDWGLLESRFPTDDLKPEFSGLFRAYAGHRIPILNLSVIPVISMAGGDPRFLVGVSVVLSLVIGCILVRLAQRTLAIESEASGGGWLITDIAVISLAVASPMIGHAWLWWICWTIFLPFACAAVAMVCVLKVEETSTFSWGRMAVVLALCWVAAMAHASGGLMWLCLIPCLLLAWEKVPMKKRLAMASVFVLNGMLILWPFLSELGGGAENSGEGGSALTGFLKLANYGLTLMGGSLGQGIVTDPLVLSKAFGIGISLGVVVVFLAAVRWRADAELRSRLYPWLSVMLFGVFSAGAIAIGRSGLPDEQALGGRYLLLTYPAWLGLFFAVRVFLSRGWAILRPSLVLPASIVLTMMVIGLEVNGWAEGYRIFQWNHATRMARVAPTNFARVFPDNPALNFCSVNVPQMIMTLKRLEKQGVLRNYVLYESDDLKELGKPRPLAPLGGGHVTRATMDETDRLVVEGYAYLPESDRPADLILLSWEATDSNQQRIFCLVPMKVRPDFFHSYQRQRRPEDFTAWEIRLNRDQIPAGDIVIRAWAFDQEEKSIHVVRNAIRMRDGDLVGFDREVVGRVEAELRKGWPIKVK